jgi:ketosteroid isomerase-like protein
MRISHRTHKLALRLVALAVLATACEDSPTSSSNNDQAADEVRAASLAWDQEYNSGDIDALMDLYHDDVVSIPPGLPALVGKQALRADFEAFFEAYTATHQTTIAELEITGDLAVERATYTWSANARDGSGGFSETGRHIVIRKRVNGAWKVLWEIWNTN